METRLYMKCIRRHCPSGLVTVPRDLEREIGSLLKEAAVQGGGAEGGAAQDAEWLLGAEKAPKVNQVCAKLYCGYIQATAVREKCTKDTCSLNTLPAGSENALSESPASFWKWLATRMHVNGEEENGDQEGESLDESTRRKVGIGQLCGLVLCAGRHAADFVSCVEERCPTTIGTTDNRASRSTEAGDNNDEEDISDSSSQHSLQHIVAVQRRSSLSDGSEAAPDGPERTLKRKRRINDDVSQCIQSYCGRQGSRTARLACIVRACHRSG